MTQETTNGEPIANKKNQQKQLKTTTKPKTFLTRNFSIVVLITALSTALCYYVIFKIEKSLKKIPEIDSKLEKARDFKILITSLPFISAVRFAIKLLTQDWAVKKLREAQSPEKFAYKVIKSKNLIPNTIWYIFITSLGVILSYGSPYTPDCVGGQISGYNLSEKWPTYKLSYPLQLYLILQLGAKIYSMINLVIMDRSLQDFGEYFIHHYLTIILILLCYYFRVAHIGTAVLILHDFGDIGLSLFKFYRDLVKDRKTEIELLAYFNLLFLFSIPRMYLQPVKLFWPLVTRDTRQILEKLMGDDKEGINMVLMMKNITLIMIMMLMMLNLFWLGQILKVGYKKLTGQGLDEVSYSDDLKKKGK